MNILIVEYKCFGIEDIKETFERMGHTYVVLSDENWRDRRNPEFEQIMEKTIEDNSFDCVFSFNYSPIVSNICKKYNLKYIAFVYDSPQVLLYSYTIINPCNYVFVFDKEMYLELHNAGIKTVYYMPLCANVRRLDEEYNDINGAKKEHFTGDISFVGAMYDEKHNLYDKMVDAGLNDFTRGYLEAIMDAQMKVYGYFFLEKMLTENVLKEMQRCTPMSPNKDGVETVEYMYAHYFLARKLAFKERLAALTALGEAFGGADNGVADSGKLGSTGSGKVGSAGSGACSARINLFTYNRTPGLKNINNKGPVDYYEDMPYVFKNSKINLNISLRSIRSGIPLRGIDIMGAGGFLLSNFQADFYDFFIPGEDMVLFESHEDMVEKCKYYLSHDAERRQIAENGYGKVKEFHTYDVRMKEIFEIVFG